jgi:NTE family protein
LGRWPDLEHPLQWVADGRPPGHLAFQVDLWNAEGKLPGNLVDVTTRQKDIQ